ncbi:unnamed protein product [Cylicocyclus nassatus]|uniref:UDP-glucuronosyltransferase n=1 Tax=Cylicocyclus nassatus TaxID=53992 RepID=A0AA36H2G3_CYLNA|nr:unnamed protein product [Cylicocyclus nassatus]
MASLKLVLCCFITLQYVAAYKMALFVPNMANSQVLFNARVAETLAKAGHDVTMIMITSMDDFDGSDVKIMPEVKIHRVNASFGLKKKYMEEQQSKMIFQDLPMWDHRLRAHLDRMTTFLTESCRKMVENKEFLRWLSNQKFDLAFAHMYDVCPIGLIHYAKIPSWIWLNSGALTDFVAYYMGVPIIPSYVPPLIMESSDHMNFVERTKSLIGHTLMTILWKKKFADRETTIFQELIDANFPDIVDIAKKCPLVMVNSNEMYDLPRPTLAKIVNIGGVGIEKMNARPLPQEYQQIVDNAEGLVVFSFGSVAPGHKMPTEWKLSFIEAFKSFPNYHVFWRYAGTDLKDKIPPNVHLFDWLPQSDLLIHPKTKAFISHGGYNSIQEAISAGVPMITIALFGDQPKNAKLAERQQFSINLRKSELSAETIADALSEIFNDQSYSERIKQLSEMVEKKPLSPSHLLVSWAAFTAEFKTLDNLVPAGNKLNFFQYHSLDVIAFLLGVAFLSLLIFFKLLKLVLSKGLNMLFRTQKEKKA